MATSNDTRVRVDGFSKIIASVDSAMPAGLNLAGAFLPARFMACAMSRMRAQRLGVERVEIEEMPRLRNGSGF